MKDLGLVSTYIHDNGVKIVPHWNYNSTLGFMFVVNTYLPLKIDIYEEVEEKLKERVSSFTYLEATVYDIFFSLYTDEKN